MRRGVRRATVRLRSAVIAVCVLLATPVVWGQVPVDETRTDLEVQLAEVEAVFFSADQVDSIALLDALIERLGTLLGGDQSEVGSLLLRSFAYRAQAHHNLGDEATARADLEQMLATDPSADVDRDLVSPKFTELFDAVRTETIGYLSVLIAPPDAVLWLDGELVEWDAGEVALWAGSHAISVERLGFRAHRGDIEVAAGESTPLETILERVSAVATFTLSPADAAARLDGSPATPIAARPGSAGSRDSPSRSFAGLAVGEHRVEISRDGYRPRTHVFLVDALADFDLGALVLERAVGTVVLSSFPAGAAVELDGEVLAVRPTADGSVRLDLAPGTYTVEVNAGRQGVFVATLEVVDREEKLLDVQPRPSIAFLGVLGEDDIGRDTLVQAAAQALDGHPLWMWQDRTGRADAILAESGLDRFTFRAAAEIALERIELARENIARTVEASAYVLAVLDDDLMATRADLWIWPGPPAPAAVHMMSFPLEGGGLGDELRNAFSIDFAKRRTYLGAQLVDSAASPYPTVIAIAADGPAASAGIEIGDEILALDGTALASVAELSGAVTLAGARDVELRVRRGSLEITVRALLSARAEATLPGVAGVPYGLMWVAAEAHAFLAENPAPDWLLGLDQAAVLLHTHQWGAAVRLLRTVGAPARAGVGQGMVDYWLGLALLQLGPDYSDHARRAFESAVAIEGATLGHDDGPLIEPLARALLMALGS